MPFYFQHRLSHCLAFTFPAYLYLRSWVSIDVYMLPLRCCARVCVSVCVCVCAFLRASAFSHRGSVLLSVAWISRIDLCKWSLWSEALSASGGNWGLRISLFLKLLFSAPHPPKKTPPDPSSLPPLAPQKCSSAPFVPSPFQRLSWLHCATGETTNPICAPTKEWLPSPIAVMSHYSTIL